jgi:hypothetical protein
LLIGVFFYESHIFLKKYKLFNEIDSHLALRGKNMIETVLLAMLVGKIKGYKVRPLFDCWEVYPVVISVIVYLFLNIGVFLGYYKFVKYSGFMESIYICTFLFLILKYKLYISSILGSLSIFIGTGLNKAAIMVNDGKMPVFPTFSYITGYANPRVFEKVNGLHVLGSEVTRFKFLTDIIDLGYSILSIGDIFIRFFTFIIIYSAIKHINTITNKISDIAS